MIMNHNFKKKSGNKKQKKYNLPPMLAWLYGKGHFQKILTIMQDIVIFLGPNFMIYTRKAKNSSIAWIIQHLEIYPKAIVYI